MPDVFGVRLSRRAIVIGGSVAAALVVAVGLRFGLSDPQAQAADDAPPRAAPPADQGPPTVDLADSQSNAIKVETVADRFFPLERQAVGNIDFNQDQSVQIYPPYQGLILQLFAKVGDDVREGQTLFTIQSPGSFMRSRASRKKTLNRRPPTSRPRKAICGRRVTRSGSSARPTATSTA
jgi:multidrug efflux pump subunit AcrA (membrane-fusion protein)